MRESKPTMRFSLSCTAGLSKQRPCVLVGLVLLLLLCSDSLALAQGSLVLTDDQGEYPLGFFLEILEDKDKQWTIDDVTSTEVSSRFVPSQERVPSFGFTDSVYWVRLKIRSEASQTTEWWLEVGTPAMSYIDLYLPAAKVQNFDVRQTGFMRPFSTREIDHHHFVFKLIVSQQTEQTVYLRFEAGAIMTLPLTLWSPAAFTQHHQNQQLVWGAYYGVFLVMLGFNAFLYLSLREKSYLYYVFYVAAIFLMRFSADGRAKQYLWPNLITWSRLVIPMSIGLGLIAAVQFTRVFLALKDTIPSAYAVLKVLTLLLVMLILLVPLVNYGVIVGLMLFISFASIPILLIVGILAWRKGYRPARYFVLAFSIPFIRNLFELLVLFDIWPQETWVDQTEPLAFPLLATLLSLALADRINVIKQEREMAQAELVREQREALQLRDQFTAALQESEEKYRSLIEHSGDAIYLLTDTRFEIINAKFSELFGVTAEEANSSDFDFMALVAPQSRALVEDRTRRLAEGEDLPPRYEFTALGQEGNEIEVEVTTSYIAYQGGIATQGILRDVTVRKRADTERERLLAEIREQSLRLRQIMDTVPEGVLLLDREGRVLLANSIVEEYLTTLAEVQVGDVITQLGDRPLDELLTSPSPGLWHQVKAIGHPPRFFEAIARPMEDGAATEGWVLVILDVTQEREAQRYLQQQDRLAAVGQLAAGIAHDFNNIMAVIKLYAQLSQQTPGLPAKIVERLATIEQQAERAADLIHQILDFSRRGVIERQPFDLLPLLEEQLVLLERTLPESIRIALRCRPDEYIVSGDPTRIQQVLMNLALNARDAMLPNEGGELEIKLKQMRIDQKKEAPLPGMKAGNWVQLMVRDNGIGMHPEILPHIFEPFFSTKPPDEGTGLGLAQVYGIVKQHEGYIDVESDLGHGATFSIYLPALNTSQSQILSQDMVEIAPGQGETILVVEDDPQTRAALVESLKQLNYQVLEVANGQEALSTFEQHKEEIALILSDMVMPKMGGRALAYALREQDPGVRVLVLSGHPLDNVTEELDAAGVVGWIEKPVSLNRLAQEVARALR